MTRHALRNGRFYSRHRHNSLRVPAALLRLGTIARAGRACCYPSSAMALGVKALVRMRFRLRASRALLRRSTCDASVRSACTRVRPLGLCRTRRPVTLLCRGVQERRRHNPQVGTISNLAYASCLGTQQRGTKCDVRVGMCGPLHLAIGLFCGPRSKRDAQILNLDAPDKVDLRGYTTGTHRSRARPTLASAAKRTKADEFGTDSFS